MVSQAKIMQFAIIICIAPQRIIKALFLEGSKMDCTHGSQVTLV